MNIAVVMTNDHEYFHALIAVTQQHYRCRVLRLRSQLVCHGAI
jgi:hypothetical protein